MAVTAPTPTVFGPRAFRTGRWLSTPGPGPGLVGPSKGQGPVVHPAPGESQLGRHGAAGVAPAVPGADPAPQGGVDLGLVGGGRRWSPATTTTTSPRTSRAANSSDACDNVPRQTSSCSLVSSRATTTARSAPKAPARSARVPARRPGASWIRTVRSSVARAASRRCRSAPRRARKPSKQKRSVGSPLTTSAITAATGPGTAETSTPAATAAATSREPGSETVGVPASLTTATVSPAANRPSTSGRRAASLRSCSDTSRRPLMPAWVRSPRVRRVSSQQIRSARPSTSTARGERSPRFPMGVDTITRRPSPPGRATGVSGAVTPRRAARDGHRSAAASARRPPTGPPGRCGSVDGAG